MRELDRLNEASCEALLRRGDIGRVAISTPKGPHVTPVSYAVVDLEDGPVIAIRAMPHSVLASQATPSTVTIEVDQLDHERREGWTVSARGRCELVTDAQQRAVVESAWSLPAWPGARRSVVLLLHWNELLGHRLGSDWDGPSTDPVVRPR